MAGGAVAATRIDCPCGESFMKFGNERIKCPKETKIEKLDLQVAEYDYFVDSIKQHEKYQENRIKELESAMREAIKELRNGTRDKALLIIESII